MKPAHRTFALLAALALAPIGMPARAHHSFAMFDPTKPMKFEATVQSLQWTAPHAVLWVDAPRQGGYDAGLWSLELPTSPANLAKMGWTRNSVKAGDKVIVEINPMRDGRRGGQFKRATLVATGQVLSIGAIPGVQPPK